MLSDASWLCFQTNGTTRLHRCGVFFCFFSGVLRDEAGSTIRHSSNFTPAVTGTLMFIRTPVCALIILVHLLHDAICAALCWLRREKIVHFANRGTAYRDCLVGITYHWTTLAGSEPPDIRNGS